MAIVSLVLKSIGSVVGLTCQSCWEAVAVSVSSSRSCMMVIGGEERGELLVTEVSLGS